MTVFGIGTKRPPNVITETVTFHEKQRQQAGLSALQVRLNWSYKVRRRNGRLYRCFLSEARQSVASSLLPSPLPIISALLMRRASRDSGRNARTYSTNTHRHARAHTAQSISPGPTLQLGDKWCGVSAGFCAKLCSLSAVCRTALWRNASASTVKSRGGREH